MAQNEVWPKGVRGISFLVIILGIFFSFEMGNRPFVSPDEGRYVEIPREMVVTGDYITPRLNGMKYFEKPPLFYWMQAATIKMAGIDETSMRFWIVLFAILGCLSVFYVGIKCYSRNVGVMAAGILATSLIYYCHSRLILLDLVLSVLLCGSLWAFFLAFVKENQSKVPKRYWTIAMYALSALACMTKGLVGAVLPGLVVFLWMLFTNNWKKLKEILYFPGILVFLAIFLPWHILAAQRNHDFLYYYFVVEHFLRYTTNIHYRYQPAWFFVPIIFAGMIPWTGLSLMSLKNVVKKSIEKNSEDIFLACWIFGIFGFFSFSNSKLIPYVLPIVPPIALATALFVDKCSQKEFRIGAVINVVLFLVAGVTYYLARDEVSDVLENADARLLLNIVIGILVSIGVVFLFSIFSKISKKMAIVICIFLSGNMLWTLNKLAPYYQEQKKPSTKNVAKYIRANKTKDDLVFCYYYYYQDLPVYLNDTVGVTDSIRDLEFGANAEPEKSKIMSEEKFWKLWNTTKQRIFLVLSRSNYRKVFVERTRIHNVLTFDENFVVMSNK